MSKFEQLLDYLVNEDHERANELFHEIVVEKSREIYENLIADEAEEDEDMDENMEHDDEDETVETMFGEVDDEDDMGGDDSFPVQDQTDDFEDDVTDDEFGDLGDEDDMDGMGDDMSAPADKGDIKDLEDALEELKAEFEALLGSVDADGDGDHDMDDHEMSDDDGEDDMGGDEGDMDDMGGDEEDDDENKAFESSEEDDEEDEDMTESRTPKSQGERMREYIEKVTATMDGGLVGGRTGETMSGPKEGKSPISSGSGKPTSGATAKNIAQSGKGDNQDGQRPAGKVGGLVKTGGQFVGSGTKNVAGSANAKKPDGAKLDAVKKPGNKEGQGWGSGSGDKAGQTGSVDTNSPLNGAPNRAK